MKINNIGIISFKSASVNAYNSLSGKIFVDKYNDSMSKYKSQQEAQDVQVKNVIYNSLDALAMYGKYDTFKVLFKEIEDEEELKSDSGLYNLAGDVYKKGNDLPKAYELYKIAYKNSDGSDVINFLKSEKSYFELKNSFNSDIEDEIATLAQRKIPRSSANYHELSSIVAFKHGDIKKSKKEILTAYFIAKNNNVLSDDLAYKTAIVMTSNGDYTCSSELCKTRLDELKRDQRVYTYEFLNFLTLLGINSLKLAESPEELKKAEDTLNNASAIEKQVSNDTIRESIDYNLLKIHFKYSDMQAFDEGVSFISNCKNPDLRKNVCIYMGEYLIGKDKELAKEYFDEAETFLQNNKTKYSQELVFLYNKLLEYYPELTDTYIEKLNNLNTMETLPINTMIASLDAYLKAGERERIKQIVIETINNPHINDMQKEVAKTYQFFADVSGKTDYDKNVENLEKNLRKIDELYQQDKTNEILKNHLYKSYKSLANEYYEASSESFD